MGLSDSLFILVNPDMLFQWLIISIFPLLPSKGNQEILNLVFFLLHSVYLTSPRKAKKDQDCFIPDSLGNGVDQSTQWLSPEIANLSQIDFFINNSPRTACLSTCQCPGLIPRPSGTVLWWEWQIFFFWKLSG